jgi:hypothetical protein
MGGQRFSFEDEYEQGSCSQAHTEPINMDPYQQSSGEQPGPLPDGCRSDFKESFSQAQITGEKLVPQGSTLDLSTFVKLIPPASIFLLLLFALLGGGHVFNDIVSSRKIQSQQLQVEQFAHVVIQDNHGQVHVHSRSSGPITVRATQYVASWSAQSNFTDVDVRVVDDGGVALIDALRPDGTPFPDDQRVDLDITVPTMVALQVIAPQGAVSIDGVSGSLHIEARDSIDAQRVSGEYGSVVFKTQDGSIDADHVNGKVDFSAPQGYIEVRDGHLFGQSRMLTGTGKLVFAGDVDPSGAYSFETQSGMIAISLPQLTSFDLHLSAAQSLVSNQFEGTLIGPSPRAQLDIATQTGAVEINQAN